MKRYEYTVCLSQNGKMTFQKDEWLGNGEAKTNNWNTCPSESDYLNKLGMDNWELINVVPEKVDQGSARYFYLKREVW